MKQQFTRQEAIQMMEELLQRPDCLIDAVQNEDTDWNAESLIDSAEQWAFNAEDFCAYPVDHSLNYYNPATGKTICYKCKKEIKTVDSSTSVSAGKKLKEDEAE